MNDQAQKYFLTAVTSFKNQATAFPEWLQHHIMQGFDHFYLIDDGSTDEFQDFIEPYKSFITLVNIKGARPLFEREFIYHAERESSWVLPLKVTDFVWCPDGKTLRETLRDQRTIFGIPVHVFGSSGHMMQPCSVVQHFLHRTSERDLTLIHSQGLDQCHFDLSKPPTVLINRYDRQSQTYRLTHGGMLDPNPVQTEGILDTSLADMMRYNLEYLLPPATLEDPQVTVVIPMEHGWEETFESFERYNTHPIERIIVAGNWPLYISRPNLVQSKFGGIDGIDRAYSYVRTPWIFHCEPGFIFTASGFIEESMKLFQSPTLDPESPLWSVLLNSHESVAPLLAETKDDHIEISRERVHWFGLSMATGLRKTSDWRRYGPYRKALRDVNWKRHEQTIAAYYGTLGYHNIITRKESGYGHFMPQVL